MSTGWPFLDDYPWRKEAACKGVPIETFFSGATQHALQRMARRICGGCLVREPCYDWALGQPDLKGFAGGYSERERRAIRVRLRRDDEQATG